MALQSCFWGQDATNTKASLATTRQLTRTDTYIKYCEDFGWMLDDKILGEMKTKNAEELKQIEER
eukprot:1194574-Prorocentrum_minimum.AAC.5